MAIKTFDRDRPQIGIRHLLGLITLAGLLLGLPYFLAGLPSPIQRVGLQLAMSLPLVACPIALAALVRHFLELGGEERAEQRKANRRLLISAILLCVPAISLITFGFLSKVLPWISFSG